MTLEHWFGALNTVILVSGVIVNVYFYFKGKNDSRFHELRTAIDTHAENAKQEAAERKEIISQIDKRLSLAEQTLEHVPTHGDLDGIRAAMGDIGRTVARIEERSANTSDSVRRIEKHLLDNA